MKRNLPKWVCGLSSSCWRLSPPLRELQWARISRRNVASTPPEDERGSFRQVQIRLLRNANAIMIETNKIYIILDPRKATEISKTSSSSSGTCILKTPIGHKIWMYNRKPRKAEKSKPSKNTKGNSREKKILPNALDSSAPILMYNQKPPKAKKSKPSKNTKGNSREKKILPNALDSSAPISETSSSSSGTSILKNPPEDKILQNIQEPPKAVNSDLLTSTKGIAIDNNPPPSALNSSAPISDTSPLTAGSSTLENASLDEFLQNIQEPPKAKNSNLLASTNGISIEKNSPSSALGSSAKISKTRSLPSRTSILKNAPKCDILQNIQDASFLNKSKPLLKSGAPRQKARITQNVGYLQVPSVSRILKETMSPTAKALLVRWEEKMERELGKAGFKEYKEALFQQGIQIHSLIQRFLNGEVGSEFDSEDNPAVKGCWQSIRPVLQKVDCVHNIESHVVHQDLNYRGYVDCVAEYLGHPLMVEWKHKSKKASSLTYTYDNPLQLMAYLGAFNHDPQYPFQVQDCLLAIAYTDGSPAQLYFLNQREKEVYWQAWLERVKQFQGLSDEQSLRSEQQQTKSIVVELLTPCETEKTHDWSKSISFEKNKPSDSDKPVSNERNKLSDTDKSVSYEQSKPSDTIKPVSSEQNEPSDTDKSVSYEQNKLSDTDKPVSYEQNKLSETDKPVSYEQNKPSDTDKPVSYEQNKPSDLEKRTSQEKNASILDKLWRIWK